MSEVVKEEFVKEDLSDFIDNALQLLKSNFIVTLKQWATLSIEDKKRYPDGLKVVLDKACLLEGK